MLLLDESSEDLSRLNRVPFLNVNLNEVTQLLRNDFPGLAFIQRAHDRDSARVVRLADEHDENENPCEPYQCGGNNLSWNTDTRYTEVTAAQCVYRRLPK